MNYRREIDGLRALAVLPVILFHAGFQTFSGGFVGVDVFFVISGYLITSIILAEKQVGTFSLIGFYERRARRILPALFVVMSVSLPCAWLWMLTSDMKNFFQSVVAVSIFASNILFWRESGYFDTVAELKPLLHTWSLAVEEQYYLLFPIFLLLTWQLGKRWIVAILIVVAVISLSMAQWGSFNLPEATFYLLPTRSWELLIGVFIAFYFFGKRYEVEVIENSSSSRLFSLIGLLMLLYAVFAFDKSTPFPSLYTLIPTLGAALIILFATPQTLIGKLLSSNPLVGIGLISYSAYLWHQPFFAFARLGLFNIKTNSIITICFIIILSYFSWRYIEKPIRYHKLLKSRKVFLLVSTLCTLLFICVGIFGATKGSTRNSSPDVSEQLANIDILFKERLKLIRVGICHFNAQINPDIQYFLNQWNCFTDVSQPNLQKIPLIVTGDSHSADKVMALKLNGYVPLQIGGAECSLNPRFMNKECKLIFEKLYQISSNNKYYEYIAIANHYSEDELSINSLRETIDYWERYGKKIIFFTAMPEFPMYKESITKSRHLSTDFKLSELSERDNVKRYLASRGVLMVNTRQIFCSISHDCSFKNEKGELLMVDQNHLSKIGAQRFGEKLLKQDQFFRLVFGNH